MKVDNIRDTLSGYRQYEREELSEILQNACQI